MLVAGKFPRAASAGAALAPLFLLLILLFARPSPGILLFSNSLDFILLLLATLCSIYVARRSIAFSRQLWILLAIAFGLEAIAQALTTYYQTFSRPSLAVSIPSDIFFFIWAAPLFVVFLPPSDQDSPGLDSLRVLDFLQVIIVALTMYLYFFYSPLRWRAGQFPLVHEILLLYIVRDLLLTLGFLLRARSSVPPWFRSFCVVLAVVFLISALSSIGFYFVYDPLLGAPTWIDLFWMGSYLIIIFYALSWKSPERASVPFPVSRLGDFFAQQFLPIGLPLLVIFMARAIDREQSFLGWLAVTVSVVASSVRLILTNRKTHRVARDLLETEKALRRSEQMLSTAFRASPDAFSINAFPNGPFLEINDGFTALTGYTREDILGKRPSDMELWLNPAERSRFAELMRKSSDIRDEEFRFRTKSGQIRVGLMSASLIELDSRTCALVVVRDITSRKEAEEILRTSEERFRSLVQNLHVGMAIYGTDGRVSFANHAVLATNGTPRADDIIGQNVSSLGYTAFREDGSVIPEHLLPVPTVLASHKPVRNLLMGLGRAASPTIWILVDAIPEFSSTGELTRVVVSFTDLTEQRRALEALRESEERFRTLVAELHVAVVLHRPDGHAEFLNRAACEMLGLPDPSNVVGKHPSELGLVTVSEGGRELTEEERPVSIVIRTRSAVRNSYVGLRRRDTGETCWVFGSSVPHLDSAGNLIRVITSYMDVTEQRRAADALRESEERFRTLVRDLSVAVILLRPDARIEFANSTAYRMFNVPEGAATGKTAQDLAIAMYSEDGRELLLGQGLVSTVMRTRQPMTGRIFAVRRPGSDQLLWVFGNAVPQFDAQGNIIRVITSFADITEMKNAERAIHQLSTQLLRLQDEERRRIGRELHDGLAQTVLAINLSLAQVRQSLASEEHRAAHALDKARALTQQMSREIRTLSYLLHPPLLDDLGLVSALREYAQGFSERSSIQTSLLAPSEFSRLPQSVELALFRIVQESLANVQRHSGSARAEIHLRQEGQLVTLEIVDFGHGITLSPADSSHSDKTHFGVGIPGMRERISQLGGSLDILSSSAGTIVRATISPSDLPSHDEKDSSTRPVLPHTDL